MDIRLVQDRPSFAHWSRVGTVDRLGVVVPVASLRSSNTQGIGDTSDLLKFVRLCARAGIGLVQVLPLNDMGTGKCPYNSISAFAIDPVYLDLARCEALAGQPIASSQVQCLVERTRNQERLDYFSVRQAKLDVLQEALGRSLCEFKGVLEEFLERHYEWLHPYLVFRVAKEAFHFRSWENWCHTYLDPAFLEREFGRENPRYWLHLYVQWELSRQLAGVRQEADRHGVVICGDIPILVARDSADVFWHREWFDLDHSVGAPPDMYAKDGQNWGTPPYDWPRLWQDGCRFWRQRLSYCEGFYHLYRIDHVIGLFRFWVVPRGESTGRNGRYVPADEGVWGESGRRILQLFLDSTLMLPLAEDLGTVPPVCRQVLAEMGICGMKVQRWERRWEGDCSFILPEHYPPLSVATFSTHDSELLPHWWNTHPDESRRLYWEVLGRSDWPDRLDPQLHRWFLRWLGRARSVFYVLMLQELLFPTGMLPGDPADHRINVPGTLQESNWTWRCPVSLEQIEQSKAFEDLVREIGVSRVAGPVSRR